MFAEHDEIDVRRGVAPEGAQALERQRTGRTRVEIHPEAGAQQDVRGVLHVGTRVAEGPHEDRVEPGPRLESAVGERLPRAQVALGAEIEMLEREPEPEGLGGRGQDLDRFFRDVDADSVPRHHRVASLHARRFYRVCLTGTPVRVAAKRKSTERANPTASARTSKAEESRPGTNDWWNSSEIPQRTTVSAA